MTFDILQIIVASAGATISGVILLVIHHSRVKQELEIHKKTDEFERKQKAYRAILNLISRVTDHSYLIGSEINWKIMRHVYNEILLVGSLDVVKASNEFILKLDEVSGKKEHELIKNLWIA